MQALQELIYCMEWDENNKNNNTNIFILQYDENKHQLRKMNNYRKRGGIAAIFFVLVLLVVLSADISALTITPAQIFIPSERVANDDRIITETYISPEKGETQRTISFKIPSEYSNYISITPKSTVVSIEERVEILLKDLKKLESGEYNVEIQVLENRKPLQNSLNDKIFLKIVVPEKDPTSTNTLETNEEKKPMDMIFISITSISVVAILGITLVLLKMINERKKRKQEKAKKKEEEDLVFLTQEIERISKKISEKEKN